ncbi:TIGR03545 family protein [Aestuariibacter sp. AA17]|uniref:TIGR03545 family protein n=1 Tax=Fluctibacter corallii TaxID=2984329 RepID=A0ABT3A7P3_9ALTE|nr:TIGR03545 family protein [Aestuariibacter sp. AA17]MCV2884623.1 TIGR03545 family protein [Aestuariibacter sp. AA17]
MKNVIRWWGLTAFFGFVGLIALIVWAFLDTWIRLAAESGLESAVGAEVNIERAAHQFSPFKIALFDIQITDAARPNRNKVQIEQLDAEVQLSPLLMKKVIIESLNVNRLRFGTERSSAGEVFRSPGSSPFSTEALFGDLPEAPSVDDVLARSPLETTRVAESLESAFQDHKTQVKQGYAALPKKDTLEEYKAQLKALTEKEYKTPADILSAKEEFERIKSALQEDKARISAFKNAVSNAKQDIAPKLSQLKQAPENDFNRLKSAFAGDHAAISEVTEMVFGPKAKQWTEYVLLATDTLAPAMNNQHEDAQQQQRETGRWIIFEDDGSMPDFWIKHANITVQYQGQNIASEWFDITQQHDIIGKPTRYTADAGRSPLFNAVSLKGEFALGDAGFNGQQQWQVDELALPQGTLINSAKLVSSLLEGKLTTSGSVRLKDNQLSGNGKANLSQLAIQAKGENKLTNVIASTLSGLNSLQIDSKISGNIHSPSFQFSSNLDKQLASALVTNLSPEQTQKIEELKRRLNQKANSLLGTKDDEYLQWLQWEELATGDLTSIENMLKTKLDDAIQKEKNKLKDKLLDKLFGDNE